MPKAIQDLWKIIMTEWLPNYSYELIDAPEFEYYSDEENGLDY